jgi:hypothetical protein
VQTLGHIRHLPFFAIAFGFWMPQHLLSLWQRLIEWRPSLGEHPVMSRSAAKLLQVELALVGVVLALLLVRSHVRFGVDRSEYPVSAIEFMDQERVHGRLVVTFDWAQYALAALSPKTTVGFDGRYDTCYPQEVVDMHFDLLFGYDTSRRHRGPNSGPIDPQRVLEFADPNLVMMDRKTDTFAADYLDRHGDWVPLYRDGLTGIWGRKAEFDNPNHPNYLSPNRRRLSDATPQGIATWPGFPQRSGRDAFSRSAITQ